MVGLRSRHEAPRKRLPALRRRPPRPGTLFAHARPLHLGQLRQRPRPFHRHRDSAADVRCGALLRRRPFRLAQRLRQTRPGPRRLLRGPAPVRLGDTAGGRPLDPPGNGRTDVRALEQVPRRPVVDRGLGGHGARERQPAARRSASKSGAGIHRRRGPRAAAKPQGIRSRMGPCLLVRLGQRRLRPRNHAQVGESPGPLQPPHAQRTARRPPPRRPLRRATGSRADAGRRRRPAIHLRQLPEMPHSMHGADPELYAKTVRDWVRTLGV
jgi:hypothetical protein